MSMDITLSASMRQNLLSLQGTASLFNTTQNRLATGLKVSSAIDDPSAYFTAFAARNRAQDLSARKQEMGEAIQAVKAADAGITTITGLLQQMKGVLQSARSASTADRATLQAQFNTLRTQLDQAVDDSQYKGTNFLKNDKLTVSFNGSGSSSLDIQGFSAVAGTRSSLKGSTITGGLGVSTAGATGAYSWGNASFNTILNFHASQINTALSTLRTQSQALAANLGVVTLRQDYTDSMVATLKEGADKLTLADQNEEGANMLALQTRQQLGIISLQLASQANQGILRLF
jgi:flagellin-like hook-associated protein FlgL